MGGHPGPVLADPGGQRRGHGAASGAPAGEHEVAHAGGVGGRSVGELGHGDAGGQQPGPVVGPAGVDRRAVRHLVPDGGHQPPEAVVGLAAVPRPQSTPWATSSPARATATPAPIHRDQPGGSPDRRDRPPTGQRQADGRGGHGEREGWEAGYPSATAPTAPAAVVIVQASARAGPGSGCWVRPGAGPVAPGQDGGGQAGGHQQPGEPVVGQGGDDGPAPGGRPRSHPACPAPSSWPATQTGRTSQRPNASPRAAMSRQASW